MSAPDAPADNSYAVAQMQQEAADKARLQDKADAETKKTELANLRNTVSTGAKDRTSQYLQSMGLDPTQYGSDIDSSIQSILSGINPADENPGSYFQTAPKDIYGDLNRTFQQKNQRSVDQLFTPNYDTSRISSTMDDPIIAQILGEQRGSADQIIQNMLKRGVLTGTGATGAEADLDRQAAGVRTKLNTIGDTVLSGGRQKLTDVANKARTDAGTLNIGQAFDPASYTNNADQVFNDFVASLGDNIKSNVQGNLFQTNGLAAIGGAAQGAGNTAYNPKAAAGILDDDQSTTNTPKESIF